MNNLNLKEKIVIQIFFYTQVKHRQLQNLFKNPPSLSERRKKPY